MKIKDVISTLERFAPLPLQMDFDNAGLQVGTTEADVSGVLLCLEATEQQVSEAVERGCNMIVTHHPLLFHGLKRISDTDYVQRTTVAAIRAGITIVSMHTNLDSAEGGVNYEIAERMGLDMSTIELIEPQTVNGVNGGEGIVGNLKEPLAAKDFMQMLKREFQVPYVKANELLERPIRRVAICGGAGSFLLPQAIEHGADAFLTGEMKYNEFFDHEQQIQIAVIGHYESEQYTQHLLQRIINKGCPEVKTYITEYLTNPVRYY